MAGGRGWWSAFDKMFPRGRTHAVRSGPIYRATTNQRSDPERVVPMYDYRRMTPAERAAVVEMRRSRGFPLHKPPHPEQGAGWYFITAATFEHRRHFATPPELTALERRLLEALAASELPCGG